MSLTTQISALATRVGTECRVLREEIGALATLTTTAKSSTVAAINELNAELGSLDSRVESIESLNLADLIDDTQTLTDKVWSSSKTQSEINGAAQQVKDDLLGGAGEAYDTLKELADLITDNKDAIDALKEIAGGAVRYDTAQESLTLEQEAQARENIAAASAVALSTLETNVGDTTTDFVATFNAALKPTEQE